MIDAAQLLYRCLLTGGGWMLRGAESVKLWIERHGGPGGST